MRLDSRHAWRPLLALGCTLALVTACGDDDDDGGNGPGPDPVVFRWSFPEEAGLQGWQPGGSGSAIRSSHDAFEDEPGSIDGSVKLDGTGDPGIPNAWIVMEDLALPSNAETLAYWAAGHDRNGGDANLRVRLVDAGEASHTLRDWEEFTGSEGVHDWEERTVSIAAWAGQTVSLYFEQDDNGPGSHEQIYLDEIRILR